MDGVLIILMIIAGVGSGAITGLFGGTAVHLTVPILVVFGRLHPYTAIGIALGMDFFSSMITFHTHSKKEKFAYKNVILLGITGVIGVLIGGYFSKFIPASGLSWLTGFGILFGGVNFLGFKRGYIYFHEKIKEFFTKYKKYLLLLSGLAIGMIAGAFGCGGGFMLFFVLTLIFEYQTKKAVKEAVFLMMFIAAIGSLIHFIAMPFSLSLFAVGVVGAVAGSKISSELSFHLSENKLSLVVGITLIVMGLALFLNGFGIWEIINLS